MEIKRTEYISEDILDEDFMKTFKLVYNFQMFLGSTRMHLKDSFVTAPTLFQKCHTIFNVALVMALNVFIAEQYVFRVTDNNAVYYLSSCATGLQSLAFFCNIIHVRFFNTEANVNFCVRLQKIDRCMKLERITIINKMAYVLNALTIATLLVIFFSLLAVAWTKGNLRTFLSFLGSTYSHGSFVLEIVCCFNILMFFFIRTRFINSIIMNHIEQKKMQRLTSSERTMLCTKKFLRRVAAETHNFCWCETDVYLKEVFDGFSMFRNLFQFQVFIFCCKLVLSCLITFEFAIYGAQNDAMGMLESLTPAIFTVIDLMIAVNLGVRSELFFREVKETKRLAIKVLSMHYEGILRDKAKKMLKMIEETPPRFSVYEMWHLDANILLKMFALVTSLVLTQLQFAFL